MSMYQWDLILPLFFTFSFFPNSANIPVTGFDSMTCLVCRLFSVLGETDDK